jgi:hypothetical protein
MKRILLRSDNRRDSCGIGLRVAWSMSVYSGFVFVRCSSSIIVSEKYLKDLCVCRGFPRN